MPSSSQPIEVAIVGGGCASMAAAFELTRPELQGRYHVTIYQEGWRLGGKGASGRGEGQRIEEHGLHVWMGFYENAFRLLRECYRELDRDPASHRFARWDDAFMADPVTGVVDLGGSSDRPHWLGYFPPGAGTPGDPDLPAASFSVAEYMVRAIQLVQAMLMSVNRAPGEPFDASALAREPLEGVALLERISRLIGYGQLATLTGLLQATQLLQVALRSPGLPATPLLELVDAVGRAVRTQLEALVEHDDELRRVHEMVDLILAVLRGALRFGLATHPDGFDAINDYEWREWLLMNGAQESSVSSAFVLSLYNLPFAYLDGDPARPSAAAGEALRCSVRAFLTYRGSFFWKMRTGMGDAVFEPFYSVLAARGASFRFFHRLEHVRLAPGGAITPGEPSYVEALEFDVQAQVRNGGEYQPLVQVDGVRCWPSQPDWSQLRDGERMRLEAWDFESFWDARRTNRRVLEVGRDFDFVVLGVGLGAIPHVASEIVERDERWAHMVREVKTTATQAFQVWLRQPATELGWPEGAINITGIDGAFETWADMSHLIPEERLPEEPRSIAYFCASLKTPPELPPRDDVSYPTTERKRVRDAAIHYLNHEVGRVWPLASRDGSFRWELLVPPDGCEREGDVSSFETQFWTANVHPSSRYVLCVPGSSRHRISPLDRAIDNLTIAGDWTSCGLNVGCVEAAIMSGRLAAHALSGRPELADIIGYDHP